MKRNQRRLGYEVLEPRLAMAVVISEFLASNDSGLRDYQGARTDWIELYNTDVGGSAVDLGGWYLSDNSANPTQWQFPAGTTLAGGQYLIVRASGKNIITPELHTNFSLNADGEDVVLTAADGVATIDAVLDYAPQRADVSFGQGKDPTLTATTTLVGATSPLTVISPAAENAAVDDYWRERAFDDSAWLTGTRSVGFDRDGTNDFAPYIGRTITTTEMPSTTSPRYSAYVRYAFNESAPAEFTSLSLTVRFDDGFIAYLNGREVQRVNFGEDFVRPQPQWDSRAGYQLGSSSTLGATNRTADALTPITFDLSAYRELLQPGANVLAFHVVNSGSTSASGGAQDFLLEPVLTASRSSGVATGFMAIPSPGAPNGAAAAGVVGDTHFSVDRGYFTSSFPVAITTSTPGASIRYTLDGSLPTAASGTLYTGPISITTTTILRALAYQAGSLSSNVDTQTYIFPADVATQIATDVTLPYAPWGHDKEDGDTASGYDLDNEADWEVDPDIVAANAATFADDLKSLPTVSLVLDWDDLFGGDPLPGTPAGGSKSAPAPQGIYIHGTSSERAASFEYFDPLNLADQTHLDVAVETQGHSSTLRWNADKLSFQVKFKSPYGPNELNYPLFADTLDGASAANEFDTFILDAGFNYAWHHANAQQRDYARFVTDQVTADLQNLASGGGVAPHGKYVHLYLNGLYWGLYNLHERPDESFAAEMFGGDKDDYDVIKHANADIAHEYTWVEGGVSAEKNFANFITATRAVESNPTSVAAYQTVQSQLDIDQFLDYMIVHYYAGGGADWSHNNWYATRNRVEGLWRFHAWDQEHAFPTNDNGDAWDQNSNLTTKDDLEAPTEIHRNLLVNAEYRLRFADRVQQLLYNDGVLTPTAARATYTARAQEIDRAIIGESARWGDNRLPTDPYTRADFLSVTNNVLNTFFPVRTGVLLGQFDAAGWIPTLDAPLLNQYGGQVSPGFDVTLSLPVGSPSGAAIYYTTDGSDPRLAGGSVRSTAQLYTGAIDLPASARIKSRVFFDATGVANDWSPLLDRTFIVPAPMSLRIVELNYNPAPQAGVTSAEDLEYLELLNFGATPISLDGVKLGGFIAGATYDVPAGSTLAAGERLIIARNPTVFTQVYGGNFNLSPLGYSANLGNGGEQVTLIDPFGTMLQEFTYDDAAPWPTAADGNGFTLVYTGPLNMDPPNVIGTAGDPYDNGANWRASVARGGSPGRDDFLHGDYDRNGAVESADHTLWQSTFGASVPQFTAADGNGDRVVDAADYTVWRDRLTAPVAVASTAVSYLAVWPITTTTIRSFAMPPKTANHTAAIDEALLELKWPRQGEAYSDSIAPPKKRTRATVSRDALAACVPPSARLAIRVQRNHLLDCNRVLPNFAAQISPGDPQNPNRR